MKLNQLKSLVKQGESETLEFKSSTSNIDTAMETTCAFLNSKLGGKVLIGVKDNGTIVGVPINDAHRQKIAAEIKKIEPFTNIDVDYVPVNDDHKVIVLSVDAGNNAPYKYDGRHFTRTQSTTSRMTQEEIDYLTHKNNPQRWEALTNNDCTINDLDKTRIKEIARMGVAAGRLTASANNDSAINILKKLNLVRNEKLTNAAVILFCKKEEKHFLQSTLKLARFKGIDKSFFYDEKSIIANAFDLQDKAMDFLHFNLPVASEIVPGSVTRLETPAIPYSVLREAITNALVHRDYSNPGGSMSIARYDDRIEISNIGSLPKGIVIKELAKTHESVLRNPLIAHVFYVIGNIERWGRGTTEMIQNCKDAGNPIPIYSETSNSFSVTLKLKDPILGVIFDKQTKNALKLTGRQQKILKALKACI